MLAGFSVSASFRVLGAFWKCLEEVRTLDSELGKMLRNGFDAQKPGMTRKEWLMMFGDLKTLIFTTFKTLRGCAAFFDMNEEKLKYADEFDFHFFSALDMDELKRLNDSEFYRFCHSRKAWGLRINLVY